MNLLRPRWELLVLAALSTIAAAHAKVLAPNRQSHLIQTSFKSLGTVRGSIGGNSLHFHSEQEEKRNSNPTKRLLTETVDGARTEEDPWDVGTHVYKDFGDGWHFGVITVYDTATSTYTVKFENGKIVKYSYTSDEFDALVGNANNYKGYHIGTKVRKQVNGEYVDGLITLFEDWIYHITWEDGTNETYSNIAEVDSYVKLVQEETVAPYDPWEEGTHVYKDFGDSWSFGVITNYDESTRIYTATFENGKTETYPYDSADFDQLVVNANNYIGYPAGTQVRKEVDGTIVNGKITDFTHWIYSIKWEDGIIEAFDNLAKVDGFVASAEAALAKPYDPWDVGTHVYKAFGDHYSLGVITNYDETTRMYTVEFENGTAGRFTYDSLEFDQLVFNANEYVGHHEGTQVRKDIDGKITNGLITDFKDWIYTISWEDGTTETFDKISDVDAFVALAQEALNKPYDPWEVGTHVYKDFGDTWSFGTITKYDESTRTYTVLFENRNTATYPYASLEFDQLVINANEYVGHHKGTPVGKEVDGQFLNGTITQFQDWIYTISWGDGTIESTANMAKVEAYAALANEVSAKPYDPWEVGTHVYKAFGDSWSFGLITEYDEPTRTYKVIFENGNTERHPYESQEFDQLVINANDYVGYHAGTKVRKEVDGVFVDGLITDFQDWTYFISWQDGSKEEFENISLVDAFVESVQLELGTDAPFDPWEEGTYIRKEFDDGWVFGTVVSYNKGKNQYQVVYEHGVTETYRGDSTELDHLVENANNYHGYRPGQEVLKKFNDGWYRGTITNFEDWVYYITWEDGTKEQYTTIKEVDAMVAAAESGTIPPIDDDEATDVLDNSSSQEENDEVEDWENELTKVQDWDKDEDHRLALPLGLVCLGLAVLVTIFVVRRHRMKNSKRTRTNDVLAQRRNFIAGEYRDNLALPDFE